MIRKKKSEEEGEYAQLDLWGAPLPQKWEKFEKAREYARSLERLAGKGLDKG